MSEARIAIIGGTGLGEAFGADGSGETVSVETPFGPPSSDITLTKWAGVDIALLARHGAGHRFNPSAVPYRANIWALKQLGVQAIIASGATGSLREKLKPGHLVLCDQIIDKTFRRAGTFFDEPGLVAHCEFAEPFCGWLRGVLQKAGERIDSTVHQSGTYVCMEGPQFSTRAESLMHREWGGDLIGMTCMPETKLAREAEMCYALVAFPTDYDCWRAHDDSRGGEDLLREIMGNLKSGTAAALSLIREAVTLVGRELADCPCRDALKLAIWSDKATVADDLRKRLSLLTERHFADG